MPRRSLLLKLWDLLSQGKDDSRAKAPSAGCRTSKAGVTRMARKPASRKSSSVQKTYDALVEEMLATHRINVRKWRTTSSGLAWTMKSRNTTTRWLESPYPRGPMSVAIFLHEVGHHAIGLGVIKPRCLEEYHAWKWSIDTMNARGLNVTDAVLLRMHRSLHYAIAKAQRRGIREIPRELVPYAAKPPARQRRVQRAD